MRKEPSRERSSDASAVLSWLRAVRFSWTKLATCLSQLRLPYCECSRNGNLIERSVILCDGEVLAVDDSWLSREPVQPNPPSRPPAEKLVDRQKEMIEAALAESKGRVSGPCGAAAKLGIPSSTLESKIKALKVKKHRFKPD